jgi:hypothetical protein
MTEREPSSNQGDPRDRVVEALLRHRACETRASVDARVAAAVQRTRMEPAEPARRPRHTGARLGAWGGGIAAAILLGAIVMFNQPSTAGAVFAQARVAERAAGPRRYEVTVELAPREGREGRDPRDPRPGDLRGGEPRGGMPRIMVGTLDVQDSSHIKLTMLLPDGRRITHAQDGEEVWLQRPDGVVERLPSDARWPRWIETPDGELLVDRLDALLDEVAEHYTVSSCSVAVADGGERLDRVCATRRDRSHRGPSSIELWVDPQTHAVMQARMEFELPRMGGPGGGEGPRRGGPPPEKDARGGPGAAAAGDDCAPPPAPDGQRMGVGPGGPGGPGGPPRSIVVKRIPVPEGGFAASHFDAPIQQGESHRD